MGENKRVLITSVFQGFAVKEAIIKLSPEKIIFLLDKPLNDNALQTRNTAISQIKSFYSEHIVFEEVNITSYNLPEIAKEVLTIIDGEIAKENKILLHITEGRKLTSIGALFSAYIRREKLEGAFYITEDDHSLISLPLLNIQISENKKQLLKEVSNGKTNTPEIVSETSDLKRSTIYQNLKELKQEGYVVDGDKGWELTDLGKISILS